MDIRFVAEFENHTATTSWDKVVQADCLNRDKMVMRFFLPFCHLNYFILLFVRTANVTD